MDKSWINAPRVSDVYKSGCESFIQFAMEAQETILCPCLKCCNGKRFSTENVLHHILFNGFCPGYTTWNFHGEHVSSEYDTSYIRKLAAQTTTVHRDVPSKSDTIRDMIHAALGNDLGGDSNHKIGEFSDGQAPENVEGLHANISSSEQHHENNFCGVDASRYQKILAECDKELYPNCKYSQLYFNLTLIHIKCMGGLSNKGFTMLLEFLKDVFPFLTSLPTSVYEAKKLCNDLGLGYEKIHSCPNDCMLYWKERVDQETCHVCGSSRWKTEEKDRDKDKKTHELDEQPNTHITKKAAKVLRYFPLIPRLKRIYASTKTAKDMRWHKTGRTTDGLLRHPADGEAWKKFDQLHPEFAADPRSVRLALASDGFNPFRTMSTTYSTWPVLLIPYNLPPWLCMKQTSLILSMIIPGEKGPGNDIDIFLQPLIYELRQLWHGVDAFDAFANENFKLQASLMWTINDFPAYAMLSGWSTKGRVACPVCTDSTCSIWLKHGKKFSYMGHRRWLEDSHPYRYQKDSFDGTQEFRRPPKAPSGSQILQQVRGTIFQYGKSSKSSKKRIRENEATSINNIFDDPDDFIEEDANVVEQLWKKRSIFFDLPYWEHNLLRHNLDVMHIEKNVCNNLLGTLLNIDGKTKDDERARKDIMEMGIRPNLHLRDYLDKKPYLPAACFNMSSSEKGKFLEVLKYLKVPDGYASNISRGVNLKEKKLSNLKSHDAHILMQDILPIACKASMHSREKTKLVKVVSDLCSFFKRLCSKVLDPAELDKLEIEVGITLSEMEQLFLPSFFTIIIISSLR
ncbi:uncharacterized protein LOC130998054 [Salvia miltiorrhiza]|uniref:uncharacterized protein LOC130998054 n=1 Tax=Salvia miltiorrhiza TaxID=226208 RepID=UPI0025AC3BBD|nr:uncharacterized protein LOC130998054 [Salvia miltiorrhiza]